MDNDKLFMVALKYFRNKIDPEFSDNQLSQLEIIAKGMCWSNLLRLKIELLAEEIWQVMSY